jgi:glycosyltransferase involved in cell wall biosynthesis
MRTEEQQEQLQHSDVSFCGQVVYPQTVAPVCSTRSGNLIFSVIIPTFNSERYIGACLTALTQIRTPAEEFEIVVVDGGSSDRTREVVLQYPEVRIVNSSNFSISNSRNLGASTARAPHLVFIDSDCIVDQELLNKAKLHIQRYVCFGAFYRPAPEHGWISRVWLLIESKPAGAVEWVTAGTLIIKRSVYFELGGFNESLATGEDVDFGFRIRQSGYEVLHDPTVGSIHLGQPDRLSTYFVKEMWRGRSLIPSLRRHGLFAKPSRFSLAILAYAAVLLLLPLALFLGNAAMVMVLAGVLLVAPVLLAIRSAVRQRAIDAIPAMILLWFVYLLARSFAVFKYNQFKTPSKAPECGKNGVDQ